MGEEISGGQAFSSGTPTGTTQSQAPTTENVQTSPQAAPEHPSEDTFFDPSSITGKPELESAYKLMQASYTRKMQGLSEKYKSHDQKLKEYDAFMQNPVASIQQLASRYGLSVAQAQQLQQEQQQAQFDPQSWDEVMSRATELAEKKVLEKLSPLFNEIQQTKQHQTEHYLDQHAPDWRDYEDQMKSLLEKHPSLSADPLQLYRLAVPPSVHEQRAMNLAMKKLQQKADAASANFSSSTHAPVNTGPKKGISLDEAFEYAKAKLKG